MFSWAAHGGFLKYGGTFMYGNLSECSVTWFGSISWGTGIQCQSTPRLWKLLTLDDMLVDDLVATTAFETSVTQLTMINPSYFWISTPKPGEEKKLCALEISLLCWKSWAWRGPQGLLSYPQYVTMWLVSLPSFSHDTHKLVGHEIWEHWLQVKKLRDLKVKPVTGFTIVKRLCQLDEARTIRGICGSW